MKKLTLKEKRTQYRNWYLMTNALPAGKLKVKR